jgi:predicted nucleic acid-binding protein
MGRILVDTNVLVDVLQRDPHWFEWSVDQMALHSMTHTLCINPIIYTELAQRYESRVQLDRVITKLKLGWLDLDRDTLYLASQAYAVYRKRAGSKSNVLADFFIGAQALQQRCTLMTRDTKRYQTYFPNVELICPAVN